MLKCFAIEDILRALAEPTRRRMIERLRSGPVSVSELARPFDMSLAAVVQHLQVLEACGLVRSEKTGRVRTCRLEPDGLAPLADWVAAHRTAIEKRLDRLGEILGEPENPPSPRTPEER